MSEPVKVEVPIEEKKADSKKNEKTLCSCGANISRNNLAKHLLTAGHLECASPEEKKEAKKKEKADSKKIDLVLESIDNKLEILFAMIEDLHSELLGDDEDDVLYDEVKDAVVA